MIVLYRLTVKSYKHLREIGIPKFHALLELPRYVYTFYYKKQK